MKKHILLLTLLATLGLWAQSARAQASLGLAVYRGFEIDETALQVRGMYQFSPHWRGSINFVNYFDDIDDYNVWELNIDGHYIIDPGGIGEFYLLGGLGILGSTNDRGEGEDTNTEPGLNLGVGGQLYLTRGLSAQVELKYFLADDPFDQLGIGAGLTYTFGR
jgi:hypothetical protein